MSFQNAIMKGAVAAILSSPASVATDGLAQIQKEPTPASADQGCDAQLVRSLSDMLGLVGTEDSNDAAELRETIEALKNPVLHITAHTAERISGFVGGGSLRHLPDVTPDCVEYDEKRLLNLPVGEPGRPAAYRPTGKFVIPLTVAL